MTVIETHDEISVVEIEEERVTVEFGAAGTLYTENGIVGGGRMNRDVTIGLADSILEALTGDDPTALVGLEPVPGTSTTFIRSDGAPALDQGIEPIWTGQHDFILLPTSDGVVLVRDDDPRLTDARNPLPHTHDAEDIVSGVIDSARLGTGTADDTMFLRGDGHWAVPPGGGGESGISDHGSLTGLGDDDHPQYVTEARAPIWTSDHWWQAPSPRLVFEATASTINPNEKLWEMKVETNGDFLLSTRTDADGAGQSAIWIERVGTNVDAIKFRAGSITWDGNQMVHVASSPNWSGVHAFTGAVGFSAGGSVNFSGGVTLFGSAGTAGQVFTSQGAGQRPIWTTVSQPVGANPSASIGLAAVNGAATTFMRSDAAPALDQAIAPTWTGQHAFLLTPTAGGLALVKTNDARLSDARTPLAHVHDTADITTGIFVPARLPIFTSTLAGAVPASGGGTTNFLRADGTWAVGLEGPQGPSGPPGGGTQQSVWGWYAAAASAALPAGRVGVNHDLPASATQIWINKLAQINGIDWSIVIQALVAGDHVYLQAKADASSFHRYEVTGIAVANGNNWVIPVVTDSGSPQGTEPSNGLDVLVAFQFETVIPVGANPTGTVGLTAVNGTAETFMRSDAAPAINQGIVPTWTGQHTFTSASGVKISNNGPALLFNETDAGTDEKNWITRGSGSTYDIGTAVDASPNSLVATAIHITRTGTAINALGFTATALTWNGSALFHASSTATWSSPHTFTGSPGVTIARSGTTRILWNVTDALANEKIWEFRAENTGTFSGRTRTDADGVGASWLLVDRTGTVIDSIDLLATLLTHNGNIVPNVTSSPTWTGVHTFNQNITITKAATAAALNLNAGGSSQSQIIFNAPGGFYILDGAASFATRLSIAASTGVVTIPGTFRTGSTAPVSTAYISAVGSPTGNAFEFGHSNTAGYRSTLGHNVANGKPFLAFSAEHGTTNNTFKTRGIGGYIIEGNAAGGIEFGRAPLANADDQAIVVDMTISSTGVVNFTSSPAIGGVTLDTRYARLDQFNTFTATGTALSWPIILSSAQPGMAFRETDAAVDNQWWRLYVAGEQFAGGVINDAGAVTSTWLIVDRTGTTIDSIVLSASAIKATVGNINGGFEIESTTPMLTLDETDASANERTWLNYVSAGDLYLGVTATDAAPTVGVAASIVITRTGTVVDQIDLRTKTTNLLRIGNDLDAVTGLNGVAISPLLLITDPNPTLILRDQGEATDEKLWAFYSTASDLRIVTRTDANAFGATALQIQRTGTVVDLFQIYGTVITLAGGSVIQLNATALTSTATGFTISNTNGPIIVMEDGDSAVDEKRYRIRNTAGQLQIVAETDGGVATTFPMIIDRTGTVIDSITFGTATSSLIIAPASITVTGTDIPIRKPVDNDRLLLLGGSANNTANGARISIYGATHATNASQIILANASATFTMGTAISSTVTISAPAFNATSNDPVFRWVESDGPTNEKIFDIVASGGDLFFRTRTDADAAGATWLTVGRAGTVVDAITFGVNVTAPAFVPTGATVPQNGLYLPSANTIGLVAGAAPIFLASSSQLIAQTANDTIWLYRNLAGALNEKIVVYRTNSNQHVVSFCDDTVNNLRQIWGVTRTANAVATLSFGNATDNPTFTFLGTGLITFNGPVNFTSEIQLNASAGTSGQVLTSQGAGADPIWTTPSGGTGVTDGDKGEIIVSSSGATWTIDKTISPTWTAAHTFSAGLTSGATVTATAFNVSSSRTLKRETGKVSRAHEVLSRLRPVLYQLLEGDDSEQLGLIAEEVHEICPQLSDGKTVSYDRLALLLLADWQATHEAN